MRPKYAAVSADRQAFVEAQAGEFLVKIALIFLVALVMVGAIVNSAFALSSAPANLVAEPSISPEIDLNWDAPTTGTPNLYRIYRNLTSITAENRSSSNVLAEINGSITSYTDGSGIVGETYWYAVAAIDDDGEGPISNSDDATVAGKENPHGSYMSASNLCKDCHDIHNSVGSIVCFRRTSEKEVCYTCHDGTGSDYNVRTGEGGFGELALGETMKLSYHPVPNTNLELESPINPMRCCDCHTPHLNPTERPRLLIAGGFNGGDEFCGYCHGAETNWKGINLIGGDHLSYIGEPHGHNLTTASYTPSQAATKINCVACHAYHGADIRPLIPSTVYSHSVTSGTDGFSDNTFCRACHDVAINGSAWGGFTLYNATKHALTEATHANVTWTAGAYANEYQGGYCLNCHNPHGTNYSPSLDTTYLESFTDYQKDHQNQLCYDCHVDDKVPASDYSYRGKNSYIVSGHGESTSDGNIWPTTADTGAGLGTGGAEVKQCINCHNPHGKDRGDGTAYSYLLLRWGYGTGTYKSDEEYLCYGVASGTSKGTGCHSQGFAYDIADTTFYGSGTVNIWDLFHPTSYISATAVASTAKINQIHDVEYLSQNAFGSKIECDDCHNPHINNDDYDYSTKSRIVNPDDKKVNFTTKYATSNTYGASSYRSAATDLDPAFGKNLPDFVAFCLACHDNTLPSSVAWGTAGATKDINSVYFSIDQHGSINGYGGTRGTLKAPWQNGAYPYAALNCTDCHDPHGSDGLYHLKKSIVINGTTLTTSGGLTEYIVVNNNYGNSGTGGSFNGWCSFCHNINFHAGGSTSCSSCHFHGSGNF